MEKFTIHVFGYGETQIISKELKFKVSTEGLSSVEPLKQAIFNKKPQANDGLITDKCNINIFSYEDIRWLNKKGFKVSKEDASEIKTFIDDLITELQTLKESEI